jgi:capsular exopolysaccharide synthesis family protein
MNAKQGYTASARDEDRDSINFKQTLLKYLKYWPFLAASLSVAILAAFVLNQYTPNHYKIQSKFLIQEEANPMNLFNFSTIGSSGVLPKGEKFANETIMLKSRSVAEVVLDQLNFDVEYYEEGLLTNKEIYSKTPVKAEVDWTHPQLVNGYLRISWSDSLTYNLTLIDPEYVQFSPTEDQFPIIERPSLANDQFPFSEWVDMPFAKFRIYLTNSEKQGSVLLKFRDRESLILEYTGDLVQILPTDKNSTILAFSIETTQPVKGRDYLNTLMDVFLDNELEEKNRMARNTVDFINSQLSGIADSLNYTENKLEKFRSSHRTYNITTEGSTIFEKLSELEKALSEENYKRDYYQNLQDYLVREEYTEIVVPSGLGIEDPVLNQLIGELIRLQSDKSRFLATQTPSSPTVLEVNRKIKDLTTSIKEVLNNVNRNTSLLISDLEKRISKIENQFGRLPQTEQDLLNIKRRYSLNETLYTFLLQRRAEAAITLASNTPSNKIVEKAALNFIPMILKPLLNYFLAVLLGTLFPIAVIVLQEIFSTKIKDIKELEQQLAVPVLGTIPQNKKYSTLVVLHHPKAGITEAFRALRTNIHFLLPKEKSLVVMITSTIAGEGKTFCAINLASVYSIGGKKTLLIGCDLHKAFRFQDLQVSNAVGLSTYLSQEVDELPSVIQSTIYPNLSVLSPGPVPPNPSELLISTRFENLMEELKRTYEIIVLDSSPMGLTNETVYLTGMADLTLLILRQNYSDKAFVDDINSLRDKKGLRNIFVAFNDVQEKDLHHHGYGYGYYDEDSAPRVEGHSQSPMDRTGSTDSQRKKAQGKVPEAVV